MIDLGHGSADYKRDLTIEMVFYRDLFCDSFRKMSLGGEAGIDGERNTGDVSGRIAREPHVCFTDVS